MSRPSVVLTLVLVLVVAGCNAPNPTTEDRTPSVEPTAVVDRTTSVDHQPSTTETDTSTVREAGVQVYGGNLSVNATAVFERVERLLGVDGRPPAVVLRHPSELSNRSTLTLDDRFGRTLGVRGLLNESPSTNTVGGFAAPPNVYLVVTENSTLADIERALAHEFTHVLLVSQITDVENTGWENYSLTPDYAVAGRSIVEGVATYTADRYVERYLPDQPTESENMQAVYEEAEPAVRLFMSWYLAGARYFEQRAESPANVTQIYERPPWTTEQVLHGHAPDEEPPLPLSPSVDTPAGWEETERTTRGELFVRIALESELDRETAAEAATGWGTDVVTTYEHGNRTGYAWVLRWDTAADATEFREAFRTYLDRRTTEHDELRRDGVRRDGDLAFRHERLDDRTIAVYVGSAEFVENPTASANVPFGGS